MTVADVQSAIHPLQKSADRVGDQVEQFAKSLDRLSTGKHKPTASCQSVIPLVSDYERIASHTVERLKRIHGTEKQSKPSKSSRRRSRGSSERSSPIPIHEDDDEVGIIGTTVKDLHQWEEEQQTWRLLSLMLRIEFPLHEGHQSTSWHDNRFERPHGGNSLHRYSSEAEIWQEFLAQDDSAWEKHTVLQWLRMTAESSGEDIESIVEHLETGSDRGVGLHPQGWLYSREMIKNEKRLRSWPLSLDPNSPSIDTSLADKDSSKKLVTQLDPDVFSRQARELAKADVFFERAIWLACWEMLRRGRSWASIREWCQTRKEGWRALSMHGDARMVTHGTWKSRALWRRTCAKAAKLGGIDEYENAVFGFLSGDVSSVEKVARKWDDLLFAHYNASLVRTFDVFVEKRVSSRRSSSSQGPFVTDFDESTQDILRKMENTAPADIGVKDLMKTLQATLISKRFKTFITEQGHRLAQSANETHRSKIMNYAGQNQKGPPTTPHLTLDDHSLLRILTHIILIFQESDPALPKSYAIENIIVAYIDYLSKAGKQQLLPLYVSRLSPRRAVECMARQLPFITDARERQTTMKLMQQYAMNVNAILDVQLVLIMMDSQPTKDPASEFPRPGILDYSNKNSKIIRPVKKDFIGNDITGDEQDLINGFEWFLLLEGLWSETMRSGTILYRHFLRKVHPSYLVILALLMIFLETGTGRLAAAKVLSKTVTFSMISLGKTQKFLGRSTDIATSEPQSEDEYDESDHLRRSTRTRSQVIHQDRGSSTRRRRQIGRDLLLSQSTTFLDLENLIVALRALEEWKDVEVQAVNHPNPRHAGAWKKKMRAAHDTVVATMQPLLHGWLQSPRDDDEARDIQAIKVGYLPEVILAYNSVLNFGGHALSRDILLKCMDLAATVAAKDSELAEIFVAAGRMSELVESMAIASKSILRAEEIGQQSGKKGKRVNGETMDIWSVKVAGEE
ncbi:Nucleoporin nup84 [Lambiella insularis]|nr:Nucleoporin nup84 [Lambiella insularis]